LCFNATFSNISAISWRPVLFVKKHGHHVTLKILIGGFSRNFFSRTAEGIELKPTDQLVKLTTH
jgi:predicted component of type VI protein secretion system